MNICSMEIFINLFTNIQCKFKRKHKTLKSVFPKVIVTLIDKKSFSTLAKYKNKIIKIIILNNSYFLCFQNQKWKLLNQYFSKVHVDKLFQKLISVKEPEPR